VIEDFLQNRLKKKEDIMLFKPPRYYSQFAQKAKELFQTEKLGGEVKLLIAFSYIVFRIFLRKLKN
jgi:hypothetical protein